MHINRTPLPSDEGDPKLVWKSIEVETSEGEKSTKYVPIRENDNRIINLFIGHVIEERTDPETESLSEVTLGLVVPVHKPLTRARAIDAAEAVIYGLRSAKDSASFTASLSRKQRLGEDLDEVEEHDSLISWVKSELTKIGIR